MKILIIANGDIKDVDFHKDLANKSDIVICADGGVNFCKTLEITPDYVIGDFDSVDEVLLEELKANEKTQVMYDPDQDKTDLELAIELAHSLDSKEINIIGGFGERMDHTLGNILCLNQIDKDIKAKIINEKNIIELVEDLHELEGESGDIVSIIPLNLVTGLTYQGLKWGVEDKQVDMGWLGICNKLEKEKGSITLDQGKVLVIKSKD